MKSKSSNMKLVLSDEEGNYITLVFFKSEKDNELILVANDNENISFRNHNSHNIEGPIVIPYTIKYDPMIMMDAIRSAIYMLNLRSNLIKFMSNNNVTACFTGWVMGDVCPNIESLYVLKDVTRKISDKHFISTYGRDEYVSNELCLNKIWELETTTALFHETDDPQIEFESIDNHMHVIDSLGMLYKKKDEHIKKWRDKT